MQMTSVKEYSFNLKRATTAGSVIVAGIFIAITAIGAFLQPEKVLAATTFNVNNETLLQAAVVDAADEINIVITSDFTISNTVSIPAGKTITITSDNTNRHTLTRGTTAKVFAIDSNDSASLTFTNVILDGDKTNVTGTAPYIRATTGTVNIGQNAIIQNNDIALSIDCGGFNCGAALGIYGTNAVGNVYDNALIINNSSSGTGGGGAMYLAAGILNVYGNAIISNNTSAQNGGGILTIGASSTLNVYGNAKLTGNNAATHGGAIASATETGITKTSIFGNVEISGNSAGASGGGVHTSYADIDIYGNAKITGNNSSDYGGGAYTVNSDLDIFDDALISNNQATGSTGGLYIATGSNVVITDNVQISDNRAADVGAIRIVNAIVEISGNVKITDNTANTMSGAIYVQSALTKLTIKDNVLFDRNVSNGTLSPPVASMPNIGGGALSVGGTVPANAIAIGGNTTFSHNTSVVGDGGAIYVTNVNLNQLAVGSGVKFINNSAPTFVTEILPADQASYNNNILATTFTSPFTNAYNNYDIAYRNAPASTIIVDFDSKGGSNVSSQFIQPGGLISNPASPTKSDYTFAGWSADATLATMWNFQSDVVSSSLVPGVDRITLYAKWDFNPVNPPAPNVPDSGAGIGVASDLSLVIVSSIVSTIAICMILCILRRVKTLDS